MWLLLAEDEKELSSFWSFLVISILISIAGILVVFALVLIFSKIAVKPFAESYEKQKRFITDASHEIKTPLTIIEANTEVLEMTWAESEWTQSIRNQIKRLSSLTQKLDNSTWKGQSLYPLWKILPFRFFPKQRNRRQRHRSFNSKSRSHRPQSQNPRQKPRRQFIRNNGCILI